MLASWYFLGCVLAPAQGQRPADARFQPHLARSQELVYRGTYGEDNVGERRKSSRSYRVETRVFVLDTNAKESELAFFTVLKNKDGKSAEPASVPGEPTAVSLRLERVHVDPLGKLSADTGVSLGVPLDGVPTGERGIFAEVPSGRRKVDETSEAA